MMNHAEGNGQEMKHIEIKPIEMIEIVSKFKALDLKPGHYVFIVSEDSGLDMQAICSAKDLVPKGSTGGTVFLVRGDVDEAMKIFRMENDDASVR